MARLGARRCGGSKLKSVKHMFDVDDVSVAHTREFGINPVQPGWTVADAVGYASGLVGPAGLQARCQWRPGSLLRPPRNTFSSVAMQLAAITHRRVMMGLASDCVLPP